MNPNNKWHHDIGLVSLKSLVLCAYISLIFIKPTGEGWGRGWNLIGYWLYVSPAVFILGGLHLWRQKVTAKKSHGIDTLCVLLAFVFPVIAAVAIKLKS